jgi:glycosyltransferase involved in cell wall biosynthesis
MSNATPCQPVHPLVGELEMGHRSAESEGADCNGVPPVFYAAPVQSGSVVVCTRNRRRLLGACLASLDEQSHATPIIVVDNGSSDSTPEFLRAWSQAGPDRVAVSEPIAGLSRARNVGVDHASGDVVLFLDDDALAPPGWVYAHLLAYDDEAVQGAGGPIVLDFIDGRPSWVTPRLDHWWSALDHGSERKPFPPPHGPYGANMSARRAALLEAGGFDPRLGRRGKSLLSSEEAGLYAQIWAAGGTIMYLPEAIIIHQITRDRVRPAWILRRGVAQGRTNVRRMALNDVDRSREIAAQLTEVGRDPSLLLGAGDGWSGVLDEAARRAGHLTAATSLLRPRRGS